MKNLLKKILQKNLSTTTLLIFNNSKFHLIKKNHSHYKLIIVSERFSSLSLIRRHQLVNSILLKNNISIYSIDLYTYTQIEWNTKKNSESYKIICSNKRS
ncbi:BolA family protein [Buchnera aphidicola]|uniref:BolA family transcriptional regulator n=1 Tax=Buchnera aphidicola (Anoecia oenotherae) TaxID=1241833 RepID=A0A4D6XZN6_9GAMM|nr:BolA family protein [Buchnera aphidicola]QCI19480.1 BolA family transcriptional regulator [Buchnera aphidicola (Anoecia oenotherae)]